MPSKSNKIKLCNFQLKISSYSHCSLFLLQNTFVYVRRQNLTLCLETHEEETVKELKIQVSTIIRQFPEDIALFAMLGKKEEEMEEKEKEKKEEEKKDEKSGSRGRGANKEKVEQSYSPPKPPGDMTVGKYGYNPRTASVFSPATIGLAYRYIYCQFNDMTCISNQT